MLAANHVPATFFEIGEQVTATYAGTLRLSLRDGDALGNHTWSHPFLPGARDLASQLQRTDAAISNATGYTPCLFRPPYGASNRSIVATARSFAMATILWNVDPFDWRRPGVGAIEQRVLAELQPGAIIETHDGGGDRSQTLAAYPYVIDAIRQRGYRFVTVPQLLGFHTLYRECTGAGCRGEGVHGPLPKGSIVEPGPR